MSSETTAAAAGQTGVLRHDPMAMLPFCGYHMGDYFAHWLEMGRRIPNPPAIFQVNWFRKDENGNFLWPGYGENVRVLIWMLDRIKDRAGGRETPIGFVPEDKSLHLDGLEIPNKELHALLDVNRDEWREELPAMGTFFDSIGDRIPDEMRDELNALTRRIR
jgi:phosphoenolpyruvate carboxykinase (GTP)